MASWSDSRADTQARRAELVCLECRLMSAGEAPGWRAYLTFDGEIGIYCPGCAEREFGGDQV
jgi:hypothetical protein